MTVFLLMDWDYDTVSDSFGRCCLSPVFLDAFYETFLAKSPEIPPLFANTDFETQKEALRASIGYTLSYVSGREFGREGLVRIAKTHSRKERNIKPRFYPLWLESLCETLARHDPRWNPDLERQWCRAMQKGIDFIISRY